MTSIFIAAPKAHRDERGQPTKMFFGYRTPPEDFVYMSIACKDGVLTFSDFGIALDPIAWSAVISGERIRGQRVQALMINDKDGIRAQEKKTFDAMP